MLIVFCTVHCVFARPALPADNVHTIQLPLAGCTIPEGTICKMYGWGETKGTNISCIIAVVHPPILWFFWNLNALHFSYIFPAAVLGNSFFFFARHKVEVQKHNRMHPLSAVYVKPGVMLTFALHCIIFTTTKHRQWSAISDSFRHWLWRYAEGSGPAYCQ